MVEVPDAVLEELAGPVAAAMPLVAARIPKAPAAELGRMRAIADGEWPLRGRAAGHRPPIRGGHRAVVQGGHRASIRGRAPIQGPGPRPVPAPYRPGGPPVPDASPALDALGSLPPLLVERLLGALEMTVPELDPAGAPDLTGFLPEPFTGGMVMEWAEGMSEAVSAAAMLDQIRPGATPLAAALARRLAAHPRVAGLLEAEPENTDEAEVAAAHGAGRLALAVAASNAVLHRVGVRPSVPAVLGVAVGTAALLLREAPMPPGYAAAVLAKARAEYLLPAHASGSAQVSGHRFALLEGGDVPEADFGGNGLVAVVPGGAVIRTGTQDGHVPVLLSVLDGPPPDVDTGWEEIVEVSWRAAAGAASLVGAGAREPHMRRITPPWPGDYRLRVHARGRDDAENTETYRLVVWEAPAAPEIVHARADRLGHRLRGEPEPSRPALPEAAYRWLDDGSLSVAATVTVVTGADVGDVLRAFNADPARPESMRTINEDLRTHGSIDPWVAVLDVGDAVLAVEYNGTQGSHGPVLTRASAGGRAASMFWNVNGRTRLSFAEHGEILLSEEPLGGLDAPPGFAEVLAGLDFADFNRRTNKMGMVAVERFTGRGLTADDLARIEAADIGFRIVPDLPPLYPRRPQPGGPLGAAAEALTGLPEPALRDLAWWAAAEAARHAGIGDDPDIAASVAARALTPDAHLRARRSQLGGGEHLWVWYALHRATNPDALGAADGAIDAARCAAGPHAANLIADAQARITALGTP